LTDGYTDAPESFLFSLRNKDNLQSFKAPLKNEDNEAILRKGDYAPTFGSSGSFQLLICNNARSDARSYTVSARDAGNIYQPPAAYSETMLAGSEIFKPSEVEVLYLN
jgi:hypothetical protein